MVDISLRKFLDVFRRRSLAERMARTSVDGGHDGHHGTRFPPLTAIGA
jgi:hypothetical protein